MGTAFHWQKRYRVVLGTPSSRRAVIINLTFDDDLNSLVKRSLTLGTVSLVSDLGKVTLVVRNVPEYLHDIGHQVVVKCDVILIAATARQWPILRPAATAFLSGEEHVQCLLERFLVFLHQSLLIDLRQEPHLHRRRTVVQTGVLVDTACIISLVELDVLHPTTAFLLVFQHFVGYLLSLFAAIPVCWHLARTDVRPLHARSALRIHVCRKAQQENSEK